MNIVNTVRLAGVLIIVGMVAGILSVAPAADSPDYLTEAVEHSNQIVGASIFQLVMSLCYIGVAMLLYPVLARYGKVLSLSFLSFRVIAVCLSLIGTVLLLSILSLSEHCIQHTPTDLTMVESLGYVLKSTRDNVNHVFMVLLLCIGNISLYALLMKNRLVPLWLSIWGIGGALLSIFASMLVLFQMVDIITNEYLILNAPTAVFEMVFSIWLIAKGMDLRLFNLPPSQI